MTTYTTLPDLSAIVGDFKFTLYSDFAGLTVPTIQTVLEIGELEETADIEIGVHQLSTLRIVLRDDYSTYSYGFWFKVLSGETHLRIYLNQGGSDLFYFFGIVQADTVNWREEYIGGTERIRIVTFELVSMAFKLMDTLTTDWVDDVVTNALDTNSATFTKVINPKGLFAAMLSASGLNPTYSIADVSYVWNAGPDFIYLDAAVEYDLDDIHVPVQNAGAPPTAATYFSHVDNLPNLSGLEHYYVKIGAMLGDLLKNFGLVMRMDYDTAGERHLIQLIQRGRAYAATLDFEGRETSSIIRKSFDLLGDATRCTKLLSSDARFCWFSKKYSDAPTILAPEDYVDFDSDSLCIWCLFVSGDGDEIIVRWDGISGNPPDIIDGIKYRDYNTDTDVTATATNAKMEEAIAGYIYHRFTNEYASFIRRYSKFQAAAGSDHTSLNILRRTLIDDGLATNTCYANSVKKIADKSEVEIEWILE